LYKIFLYLYKLIYLYKIILSRWFCEKHILDTLPYFVWKYGNRVHRTVKFQCASLTRVCVFFPPSLFFIINFIDFVFNLQTLNNMLILLYNLRYRGTLCITCPNGNECMSFAIRLRIQIARLYCEDYVDAAVICTLSCRLFNREHPIE